MEFLFEYGLFLAEAVTIVAALGAIIMLAVGRRRASATSSRLEVTDLTRHYRELGETLESSALAGKALKAYRKSLKHAHKAEAKTGGVGRSRLFVLDFHGDIRATGVAALREEVSAILSVARDGDEALVRIENSGGMVHGHGLAASQLARLRTRGIPLAAAVDKVAASGGYLMACVANRILAAPFAVLGSIGVLAQIPNFHRMLDRAGVDFEIVKAGAHKRTLTFFGENSEEDRQKMQADIEQVHVLFKRYVAEYRKSLDVEAVATGEHWYGMDALERGLADELLTSDDYLLEASENKDILHLHYAERPAMTERLASLIDACADRLFERFSGGDRVS